MDDILFRSAKKEDCRDIARLYSISSDGVADYIWSQLAQPGEELLEVGRRRYEREDSVFSYKSCTIAEREGKVVGMLVAFPMHVDPDAPPESDPVLAPYSKLEEDNSYYICGVALLPECRGRGVGSQLLERAETEARRLGFSRQSLIVFERNEGAVRLYRRLGFIEKAREPVVPHPLIHYTGDALLMVRELVATESTSRD